MTLSEQRVRLYDTVDVSRSRTKPSGLGSGTSDQPPKQWRLNQGRFSFLSHVEEAPGGRCGPTTGTQASDSSPARPPEPWPSSSRTNVRRPSRGAQRAVPLQSSQLRPRQPEGGRSGSAPPGGEFPGKTPQVPAHWPGPSHKANPVQKETGPRALARHPRPAPSPGTLAQGGWAWGPLAACL